MKQSLQRETRDIVIEFATSQKILIRETRGINERLDLMNGKLYAHEGEIAELQEKARHSLTWKKFAGVVGGIMVVSIGAVVEFIRKSM